LHGPTIGGTAALIRDASKEAENTRKKICAAREASAVS